MKVWRLAAVAAVLSVVSSAWAAEKHFNIDADPAKDLAKAVKQAQKQHKRILLDVGGDWCIWCLALDRTFEEDKDLHKLLNDNYVFVKVNFSKENQNKEFLGQYPKAKGYPQWYLLDENGKLIKPEDTSELEATHKIAQGYNKDALRKFLTENKPGN